MDTGKGFLALEDNVLVETIDVCEIRPQLVTYSSLTLCPRTVAVMNIHVDLKGNSMEHTNEVKPNSLMYQYPNMVIIPVIHITPTQTDNIILYVVINLCTDSISLSKPEVLGFLDQTDTEICEIMTSWALEPIAVVVTLE